MKKLFAFLMITVLVAGSCLAGCGDTDTVQDDSQNDNTVVQTEDQQQNVSDQSGVNAENTSENTEDSDKAVAEAQEKAKAEAEAKAKAEAEQKQEAEAEAEAKAKAKAEADKKAKAEAEKKARAESSKKSQQSSTVQKKETSKTNASQGISWPDNKYTALLPKPSTGTLQNTGIQDGIYCMLFSGTTISDAKAYAATLISSGYSNEVTETISGGTYLFGGGSSSGAFVVVNYQDGQMMVGIQP